MNKCLLSLASLLTFCIPAHAQNLVVNPSFEFTSSNCSNFGGEGFFSDLNGSWNNASNNVGGDSCSSPDLFSSCNTIFGSPGPTHMPSSLLGFQYSHTGTRHAGIITHEALDEYREYIQGHTTAPLSAGQSYCVSMYVSLGDDVAFATNNIGVYFSNTEYLRDPCPGQSNSAIYETPQLNYDCDAITDTSNWVRLQWNYVAAGGEQHFVIGNFFTNANTAISSTGGGLINPYAYYFIDDVSIVAEGCCYADVEPTSVHCIEDTPFNLQVTGGIGTDCLADADGTWSGTGITNGTLGTFDPSIAGIGVHTATFTMSCAYTTTTSVIVSACAQLSVCVESNGDLTVSGGTGPYTWNIQTADQDCSACLGFPFPECTVPPDCAIDILVWTEFATGTTVTPPGTWPIQITDSDGGVLELSGLAGIEPCSAIPCDLEVALISSQDACDGNTNGSITVNSSGGLGNVSLSWNTAPEQTGPTATGLGAGTYTVIATDQQNCTASLAVTIATEAVTAIASDDTTICKGGSATLSASGGTGYVWDNGGGTGAVVTVYPGVTTTYTVTVTGAGGCPGTDEVVITVYEVPAVSMVQVTEPICNNASPIQLIGNPVGGFFTGIGMSGNMFDPAVAGVGTHVVTYTYFEEEDCPNSDSTSITVDICTNLTESVTRSQISIVPNPSTGTFLVNHKVDEQFYLSVSDMIGREILFIPASRKELSVNLVGHEPGMYILKLRATDTNRLLHTERLILR